MLYLAIAFGILGCIIGGVWAYEPAALAGLGLLLKSLGVGIGFLLVSLVIALFLYDLTSFLVWGCILLIGGCGGVVTWKIGYKPDLFAPLLDTLGNSLFVGILVFSGVMGAGYLISIVKKKPFMDRTEMINTTERHLVGSHRECRTCRKPVRKLELELVKVLSDRVTRLEKETI